MKSCDLACPNCQSKAFYYGGKYEAEDSVDLTWFERHRFICKNCNNFCYIETHEKSDDTRTKN